VGLATDISGHSFFSSDIYLYRLLPLPTVISAVCEQSPAKSMLRDNREDEWGARLPARNVLGEPLEPCSIKPMTGFYRDGMLAAIRFAW
jgi:hypothetical protein